MINRTDLDHSSTVSTVKLTYTSYAPEDEIIDTLCNSLRRLDDSAHVQAFHVKTVKSVYYDASRIARRNRLAAKTGNVPPCTFCGSIIHEFTECPEYVGRKR